MHTNDFNNFTKATFENLKPSRLPDYEDLADMLKATTKLPEEMRTPTSQELSDMNNFMIEYKKQSPNASKREIRRAVQKKFNVHLLPNL